MVRGGYANTPEKIMTWREDFDNPGSLEKFAELIVAECLEACSRANEIRHFVPPTQEQVVLSCMREIETTFRS
jgi:hypothetical protein